MSGSLGSPRCNGCVCERGRRDDGRRSMMTETSVRLDERAMVAWGERIGREVDPPAFIALRGDLGAGKSTLARAIAHGAGVEGDLPSPTFNLLFRYDADRGIQVVHIDLYRLEDPEEVWELGWGELPAEDEVVLIEWPERAEGLLPPDRWEVVLLEADDGDAREISVRRLGSPGALSPLDGPG